MTYIIRKIEMMMIVIPLIIMLILELIQIGKSLDLGEINPGLHATNNLAMRIMKASYHFLAIQSTEEAQPFGNFKQLLCKCEEGDRFKQIVAMHNREVNDGVEFQ